MNFKKLKLWKLLAVGGVVGLVATVPIITTACSSTTDNNTDNNGNQQTSTVELNSNITATKPLHIIGSFKKLIDGAKEGDGINIGLLDKNISKLINDSREYRAAIIKNYNSIENEIKDVSFTSSGDSGLWGDDSSWVSEGKSPNHIVYYDINEKQMDVSSVNNLKTFLSKDNNKELTNVMNNALKGTPMQDKYSAYELPEGSALLVDKNYDYLRIHVKATPKTQGYINSSKNNKVDMELRIPTSDINYVPTNAKITIKTNDDSKIQGITGKDIFIKYDIGVNQETNITPANETGKFESHTIETDKKILKVDLNENNSGINNTEGKKKYGSVTVDGLANSLGWVSNKEEVELSLRQQSFKNINKNPVALKLDNKKISEDLKIFNATFSDLQVRPIEGSSNISSDNSYNGQYQISIDADLAKGHYWEDGSSGKKTITLNSGNDSKNFLINVSDAIYKNTDLFKTGESDPDKYVFDDTNYSDIKKPAKQKLIARSGSQGNVNDFGTFFSDQKKVESLEKALNDELNKEGKQSVGVRVKIDKTYNDKGFQNGFDKTNNQVRILVEPLPGHIGKTTENNGLTQIDSIWLKSWKQA